ncbi:MAG TPA: AMP-binding protein [Bauldia sp.]|nr:AMP-binding protein [Bauldia sp.]
MTTRHLASYLLEAARRGGDRLAYGDSAGTRTYDEYLRESLRVAGLLRDAGAGRGDRICIALPKSFPLYVTIHAALFLNACYVPIDYTTPVERGRNILADAKAAVLITTERNLARLLGDAAGEDKAGDAIVIAALGGDARHLLVRSKTNWSELPRSPHPLLAPLEPTSEAYILYTSGSTGIPKGVVQSQRSATAFVEWAVKELGLTRDDVVPQVASVTFDLSVFDLFAATRAGACLVPIHESAMMSPVTFCRAVAKAGATVVYCVPSLILRETKGQTLGWAELRKGRLRHIVFAGEPIDKPALRRFWPLLPAVPIHNWFGPTETNVCAFHRITDEDLAEEGPIPIGRPCPYARFDYSWDATADDRRRTGELLVAGDTVLTGYWNRREETAAAIVENDGARYYRTGDYVHFNARGELVFIGRRDRQVKIHGRRIQLDEIEAAFRKHFPDFEVACALLKRNGAEPVIAAAVVGEPTPDTDAVREAAADSLPLFMMPERIVAMPNLPRNERGKVDYPRLTRMLSEAMS